MTNSPNINMAVDIRHLRLDLQGWPVLRNVSLSVRMGEFFTIVGPNGAGKTSLLRCINRINRGWRGTINVNSVSIAAFTQRELARLVAKHSSQPIPRWAAPTCRGRPIMHVLFS